MTGCASLFSTYTPGSGHIKVKIADGSLATVAGTGRALTVLRNMEGSTTSRKIIPRMDKYYQLVVNLPRGLSNKK
ncbi:hypothetical protein AAG906_035852 [Vitis piasezkii]|uniref:Uncharacterized protein n=1 Tax=Vitis vinifera TaxID=29760 RepID=A0A438CII7_VITVI|nr:hypothetical protein CK203_107712 [Vitis vinifera]